MAYTQAQLDAIDEAIISGATSVSYEGKSVTYRSLDDMMRVRALMRQELGLNAGKSTTILVAHSRG